MRFRWPAAALALLLAAPALAHEVLHEVQRGRALAVRAYESDGDALAQATYRVYSPADPGTPFLEGRTDRNGWLAFVPDAPGRWRVQVVGTDGHGLDLVVDGTAPAAAAGAPAPAPGGGEPSGAAFVLRPLVGLLAVAGLFAALFLFYRRKRAGP